MQAVPLVHTEVSFPQEMGSCLKSPCTMLGTPDKSIQSLPPRQVCGHSDGWQAEHAVSVASLETSFRYGH